MFKDGVFVSSVLTKTKAIFFILKQVFFFSKVIAGSVVCACPENCRS